jgi:hypothetical protein
MSNFRTMDRATGFLLPPSADASSVEDRYSNEKMRFQSSFMLMTVQPFLFASS